MRPFHSNRLPENLDAELLAEPASAVDVIDLTESNPTRCALGQQVTVAVDAAAVATYHPQAMGPMEGRQAVADCLTGWGRPTRAGQVMLTASTSEALSFIFKMACSPGDTVAAAVPGYPLVPHLAELEGLRTSTFALKRTSDDRWRLDLDSVRQALQQGASAVVLVSPGNPVGAYLTSDDTRALAALCNQYQCLAIFDEVFAPYHGRAPHARLVDVAAFDRAICVGGLSKAALLPQAKISWLTIHGSQAFVAASLAGLEWIGDAFLSLGVTALQLPAILRDMAVVQAALRARIAGNHAHLLGLVAAGLPATVDAYSAGWYAVIRPQPRGPWVRAAQAAREHVADALLREARVKVQPGYLFDLPGPHLLVTSLIVPESVHRAGWRRVMEVGQAP